MTFVRVATHHVGGCLKDDRADRKSRKSSVPGRRWRLLGKIASDGQEQLAKMGDTEASSPQSRFTPQMSSPAGLPKFRASGTAPYPARLSLASGSLRDEDAAISILVFPPKRESCRGAHVMNPSKHALPTEASYFSDSPS
jgi:hypothetical protein